MATYAVINILTIMVAKATVFGHGNGRDPALSILGDEARWALVLSLEKPSQCGWVMDFAI